MSFKDLLAKPVDSLEAPKPLPVGTYKFLVQGFEYGESRQKKTPYVRFKVIPIEAGPDVDTTALSDYGPINKREMRLDYFLTEDAIYRIRKFFEAINANLKLGIGSAIENESVNKMFMATVTHTVNNDSIYAEISDNSLAAA